MGHGSFFLRTRYKENIRSVLRNLFWGGTKRLNKNKAVPQCLGKPTKFAGPSAHGVSDPMHTCSLDLGSYFFGLVFVVYVLGFESLLFSRSSRARNTRGRQGGLTDQTAVFDRGRTPIRHHLKIALVFDLVFLRFWSILASKTVPKMNQKPLKSTSEIDLDSN